MGNAGAGIGGLFMLVIWGFLIVAGIMAIFVPFWVYRIRNEIIGTNRRLDKLIALSGKNQVADQKMIDPNEQANQAAMAEIVEKKKNCPKCGKENETFAPFCLFCRADFIT